jgi:hypothetical protein
VDAKALLRQERPLEVDAEQPRAGRIERDVPERREQVLLGGGDEGRQVGGDAGLEQRLAAAGVAIGVPPMKSTPPKPFTCRSMKPGTAMQPRPLLPASP